MRRRGTTQPQGPSGHGILVQGTLTEHRVGGWVKEHHAGESEAVGMDVAHWEENKGSEPVMAVAADVATPD